MPDLYLKNACIWTGDPGRPRATSLTIQDGTITGIDSDHAGEPVLDAGGRFVTPGLIDSHVHLLMGGEALQSVDLSGVESRDAFEAAIAEAHARLPSGTWLIANGWSQSNWASRELPDQSWLQCAGNRPVACWRSDLHAALVNEAAMQQCNLPGDSELATQGGAVHRDSQGNSTGLLLEAAAWKYLIPVIPAPSSEQQRSNLLSAQAHCHAFGLTAVRTMEYARDLHATYEAMRDRLTLRCAVVLLDRELPLDLDWIEHFTQDAFLSIVGCKTFIDGTFGSRTARMFEDWTDEPGNRGMLLEIAAISRLRDWLTTVHEADLTAVAHAIGDEAVSIALDLNDATAADRRFTLEHAQIITEADIIRSKGAWLSIQPLHRADDGRTAELALGQDRSARLLPLRTLQAAGARFAFGSDWPVVSCDPMPGMKAAITARDLDGTPFHQEESIDPETALRAYTVDAAEASDLPHCGVLREGGNGDLVLWSHDLLGHDWESGLPRALTTISGGSVVYDEMKATTP